MARYNTQKVESSMKNKPKPEKQREVSLSEPGKTTYEQLESSKKTVTYESGRK